MKTRKELQKNNEHELKSRQCRQNQPKSAGILPAEWRVRIEPTAKTGIVPCPCHCPVMQVSPLTKSQHSTAEAPPRPFPGARKSQAATPTRCCCLRGCECLRQEPAPFCPSHRGLFPRRPFALNIIDQHAADYLPPLLST